LKGKKVKLGVFLNAVTVKYTKSGKQFAILLGEDFTGQNEIVVWGEDWDKIGKLLVKGTAMEIQAKVELDTRSDGVQLIANAAKPLPMGNPGDASAVDPAHHHSPDQPDQDRNGVNILTLQLDAGQDDFATLRHIQRILCDFPGSTPVHLVIRRPGRDNVKLITSHRYSVRESPVLLEQLETWL
jgi:DNA polymerase III alpha subunit